MPASRYGALKRLNQASVLAALSLAQIGSIYDLSVDLDDLTPPGRDGQRQFAIQPIFSLSDGRGETEWAGVDFAGETITTVVHTSTHLDALIHARLYDRTFENHPAQELWSDQGWDQFGAETIPPVVTRGVLIDTARVLDSFPLPDGYACSARELENAVAQQNLELKRGDAVLVRTGKIRQHATDRAQFESGCPGLSGGAARWLAAQGMALFGIDAPSADPGPVPDWNDTAHQVLLVNSGIHIIENMYLEELARRGIQEFLFICLPLRIRGATGSWVRPIAIV